MKRWLITGIVMLALAGLVLAGLALSVDWWFSPLLKFVGANTELIQGLADLIQIVLWLFTGLAFIAGLWLSRWAKPHPADRRPPPSKVKAQDQAMVATQQGVVGGQVGVGGNVYGDIHIIPAGPVGQSLVHI